MNLCSLVFYFSSSFDDAVIQNFFGKLVGSPNCGTAYRDETSFRSETITETRGILSIYVIIDTSLLIYGVTRDTVQRAGRKNLEEEEEEREEWEETRRKGRYSSLRREEQRVSFDI